MSVYFKCVYERIPSEYVIVTTSCMPKTSPVQGKYGLLYFPLELTCLTLSGESHAQQQRREQHRCFQWRHRQLVHQRRWTLH